MSENTMAAVEPAIGTPNKGIERLVRVLVVPAIKQDLWRAGRLVGFPRHEEQVRRGADPDAAKADFQAANEIETVHEHGFLVEAAVAVGVLKDQNAITALALHFGQQRAIEWQAARIDIGFGDPQPPAIVDAHGDRLLHVRLAGKERDAEAFGDRHHVGGSLRRQAGKLVDIWARRRLLSFAFRHTWLLVVETKIIEVDMAPMSRMVVYKPDEDFF